MVYSPNGAMSEAKRWFGPTLGAWHSYKQANAIVFRMFQRDFFAQLHFTMFPGQPFFFAQKKLSKNVVLFSWIRLAYPSFRGKLTTALQAMESGNSSAKAGYRHLLNLRFLCEWLIPVVSCVLGVRSLPLHHVLTSDGVETGHSKASSRTKKEERVQCACDAGRVCL